MFELAEWEKVSFQYSFYYISLVKLTQSSLNKNQEICHILALREANIFREKKYLRLSLLHLKITH